MEHEHGAGETPGSSDISTAFFSSAGETVHLFWFFGGFFSVKCIIHPHPPSWWGISFTWGPSEW